MTSQHERFIDEFLAMVHRASRFQSVKSQLSRGSDAMTHEQIKQFAGLTFRMLLLATAAPLIIELVSLLP